MAEDVKNYFTILLGIKCIIPIRIEAIKILNWCIHNLDQAKLANCAISEWKSFALLSIMVQS
jgi:hypothetical protein